MTIGTKADGEDQCRSIVNEWPITAMRWAGRAFTFRLKGLDVGLSEQLIRHYLGITDVKVLLAPVPNFSSGNLPFRGAETNGGRTGFAFKHPSGRKKIFVCAWESELSDINRKAEPQCRKHIDLEADHHRVRLRAPSGKDLPLERISSARW